MMKRSNAPKSTPSHEPSRNQKARESRPGRRNKLPPEERQTLAGFHESAYRMGWATMVSILEHVVMLKDARNTTFQGASLERCQPDAVFVSGMLDAAGALFGDAAPLMQSKFGVQLQEAIMDDFWDNSRETLRKAHERKPVLPYWFR